MSNCTAYRQKGQATSRAARWSHLSRKQRRQIAPIPEHWTRQLHMHPYVNLIGCDVRGRSSVRRYVSQWLVRIDVLCHGWSVRIFLSAARHCQRKDKQELANQRDRGHETPPAACPCIVQSPYRDGHKWHKDGQKVEGANEAAHLARKRDKEVYQINLYGTGSPKDNVENECRHTKKHVEQGKHPIFHLACSSFEYRILPECCQIVLHCTPPSIRNSSKGCGHQNYNYNI